MSEFCPCIMRKALFAIGLVVALAGPACAPAGDGKIPDAFGLKGQAAAVKSAAEWSASLTPSSRSDEFVLRISAKLPPEHHIYSTTESQGAETKFEIKRAEGLEPLGDAFVPDHQPKVVNDPDLERVVEEYFDQVTWSRHFRLKSGASAGTASIAGVVRYQICNTGTCRQEKYAFDVKVAAGPAI